MELKIPAKDSSFSLDRDSQHIVPHNVELYRRKIAPSPVCMRCHTHEETTIHVFFVCRGMDELWSGSPFWLPHIPKHIAFWAVEVFIASHQAMEKFLLDAVVLWKGWEIQNIVVHQSVHQVPADIIKWSEEYLARYQAAQVTISKVFQVRHGSIWIPPVENMVKINVDAAFPGQSKFFYASQM